MIKSAFKLTPLAAGLLVALGATQVAQAGNHWQYGNSIETASAAKFGGVSVANLDGDGFPDIVLAVESGVEVFFQNPAAGQTGDSFATDQMADGRFSSDNRVVLSVEGGGVRSVVAGDFSGDGIPDIAVAGRNAVTIFVGDGARGFDATKTQVIPVITPNSDGQPGTVSSLDSNDYKDFGNDGVPENDVFHTTAGGYLDYSSGAEGLAAMDFDNDGDLDLVVDEGEAGLFVYVNNGGVLSRSATALAQATDKFGDNLTTADLNLDGFIDVVARRNLETNQLSTANVFLGSAAGFNSLNLSTAGLNVVGYDEEDRRKPGSVASCDLNNDGYLDVVSTAPRGYTATEDESATGLNVIYYWDSASESFGAPVKVVETSVDSNGGVVIFAAHDMVSCGDIDNDGDADLWLGKSCSTCSDAIFRNDGVNGSDQATFTQFINGPMVWSTSPVGKDQVAPYSYVTTGSAFADLDLDGDLDLVLNSHAEEGSQDPTAQQSVIWLNTHTDANNAGQYLMVGPQTPMGNNQTGPAIGSTVRLWECTGVNSDTLAAAPIAVKTINGGTGRGSQDLSLAHFGGVDPNAVYAVEVIFPGDNETNSSFLPVKPSSIPGYQLVTMTEGRNYSTKQNACDILAADATTDSDGDGIPDFDPNGVSDPDDDNDGILDIYEGGEGSMRDSDGDGIPDRLDLDSDNDGILDIVEFQANASHETWDTDGNGRYELANSPWDSHTSTLRPNGGVPVDSDNDGTPTFLDLDSDNDGLNDLFESGLVDGLDITYTTLDGNGDGRIDGQVAVNGVASLVSDQNGNLLVDYASTYPVDSDNDGADDYVTAIPVDNDGDGIPDVSDPDDDNDGILDIYEGGEGSMRDSDGDGIPDRLDLDSDNDGLLDIVEYRGDGSHATWDTDGDGRYELSNVSWTHESTNRPGAPVDTDSDGAANFIDLDSDGDNVTDLAESGLHTALGVNFTNLDANNDGRLDAGVDGNGVSTAIVSSTGILKVDYSDDYPRDTNRDGLADYVDPDTAIQPNDQANGGSGVCSTGWQTGLTAVGIDAFKKDGKPDQCRESEGAVAGSMGYIGGLFMLAMVGVRRRLLAAKGQK